MLAYKQGGGRIRFGREVHRFLRILLASKYMWFVHGTDYNDYIAYIIVKITINCLWKTWGNMLTVEVSALTFLLNFSCGLCHKFLGASPPTFLCTPNLVYWPFITANFQICIAIFQMSFIIFIIIKHPGYQSINFNTSWKQHYCREKSIKCINCYTQGAGVIAWAGRSILKDNHWRFSCCNLCSVMEKSIISSLDCARRVIFAIKTCGTVRMMWESLSLHLGPPCFSPPLLQTVT